MASLSPAGTGQRATAWQRRTEAPETLANATIQWLASLPPDVRPRALPVQFVRIANTLCRRWSIPVSCQAYFDDLLIDRRGGRRGFPLGILLELASLKNYFETVVHHAPQTVWDEVAARRHGN